MEAFLATITSFPTFIFTCLFIFCMFYWLIAMMGFVELDFLDFDVSEAASEAGDSVNNVSAFAGLLVKLGLQGVPFPLTLSLITVFGWTFCYFLSLLLLPMFGGGVSRFLLGIAIFFLSFSAALYITSKAIQPFRPMFRSADQQVEVSIIGKTAIVRSSRVDNQFGEANVKHGGADLIVKVRAFETAQYVKGDKVVLIEHDKPINVYKVISEQEFNQSTN